MSLKKSLTILKFKILATTSIFAGLFAKHQAALPSEVLAEQVRILYKNQPFIIFTTTSISILLFIPLYSSVNISTLLIWIASIQIVNILRITLLIRYPHKNASTQQMARQHRHIIFNALLSGILWGLLPPLFIDSTTDPAVLFIIICTLVGMIAGMIAPGLSSQASLLAFCLPIIFSLSTTIILLFDTTLIYFGLSLYVYLIILFGVSYYGQQSLIESIKIRFENRTLVEELQAQKEELSQQKQTAEQANLAKSKFLAAASHDLRQPLHALGLYLDALYSKLNTNNQRALTQKMAMAIDALKDLLQRLLDISKLDAGVVEPSPIHCRIAELCERIKIRFTPLADMQNLQLNFHHHQEILFTDPILLEQILDNLLSNAIRYTIAGSITLKTRASGGFIYIEIIDSGIGIPKSEQEAIFNEFYQLHNPERDRGKGLGLGLSIVRRLCKLLDHPLTLQSALNQGSRFCLKVPAGHEEQACTLHDPIISFGPELRDLQVLLIDDEADVREAMQELLHSWGCNAVCADSIEEAMHILAQGISPELIIADYRLRETKTGVDAIENIHQYLQNDIPAILITGDTAPERLQQAAQSSFTLLHKPVSGGQLRMALNHVLRLHHPPTRLD